MFDVPRGHGHGLGNVTGDVFDVQDWHSRTLLNATVCPMKSRRRELQSQFPGNGSLSAHYEHTLIITPRGPEIVTG